MNVAAPDDAGLHVLFHDDDSLWIAEAFRPATGADLNASQVIYKLPPP